MLWSISLGIIMKSFCFYSIVQTPVIYPCRRANGQIVTTNYAQVESLPFNLIESGMLLFILPAVAARWLWAWEKDMCQQVLTEVP